METLRAFVLLGAMLALVAPARAQDYPSRLIKLLQGFPPGGNVEFVARLLAHEMSKTLGQTVIVEAKPGQAGSLAAEAVAGAEPDGYTLLVVSGAHPAAAAVYKRLKYDPVDGLAWISTASFYPFIICVRRDSRLKSLTDLMASARTAPERTCGMARAAVATTKSTSPMSRPVTAGASPRYGTERNCTAVSRASSSVVMWEMEPFPAVPELTLPGAARALAMRSVKDLSRESRRTQIMKG